jgi:hypothetical protein
LARVLRSHISSDDPRISLDAAKWVGDHMFGKAIQKNENTGADGEPMAIRVVSDL